MNSDPWVVPVHVVDAERNHFRDNGTLDAPDVGRYHFSCGRTFSPRLVDFYSPMNWLYSFLIPLLLLVNRFLYHAAQTSHEEPEIIYQTHASPSAPCTVHQLELLPHAAPCTTCVQRIRFQTLATLAVATTNLGTRITLATSSSATGPTATVPIPLPHLSNAVPKFFGCLHAICKKPSGFPQM